MQDSSSSSDSFDCFIARCSTYQEALASRGDDPARLRAAGKHYETPEVLQCEIYLLKWTLGRFSGVYVAPTVEQAQDLVYLERLLTGNALLPAPSAFAHTNRSQSSRTKSEARPAATPAARPIAGAASAPPSGDGSEDHLSIRERVMAAAAKYLDPNAREKEEMDRPSIPVVGERARRGSARKHSEVRPFSPQLAESLSGRPPMSAWASGRGGADRATGDADGGDDGESGKQVSASARPASAPRQGSLF